MTPKNNASPIVSLIMGSDSDFPIMKSALDPLKEFSIPYEVQVISAHRTPEDMVAYAKNAHQREIQVIIAGAGGAAHLPGMVAALTPLPVIGVPVNITILEGLDSLLSIMQMPKGVPVATVAIDNAFNAGLLAIKILALGNTSQSQKLIEFMTSQKQKVLEAHKKIATHLTHLEKTNHDNPSFQRKSI